MATLFPRLPVVVAGELLGELNSETIDSLRAKSRISHPAGYFAPTGGIPVTDSVLQKLVTDIERIAAACGFPGSRARDGLSGFDAQCAALLAEEWPASVGEAYRPETWAFMTAVMLPHVAKWRFKSLTSERVWGPVYRNVFGRLWQRGTLFSREPYHPQRWELLEKLGEDTFVSIVERSSLSANPELAVALAETWLKVKIQLPRIEMESLNREAIKKVLLQFHSFNLDLMDPVELRNLLARIYLGTANEILKR